MNKLIAQAYQFIAYLATQPFWKKYKLNKIILYGSAVREDYSESSDIDLFFDVSEKQNLLNEEILKAERSFRKITPIHNDFSIIVDDLKKEKWDDLRRSMSLHAITLYDRFSTKPVSGLSQHALVSWFVSAKDSKIRVKLARTLYGYSRDEKHYPGLLEEIGAKRISRGVVLVASKQVNTIRKALDSLGVRHAIRDVYIY